MDAQIHIVVEPHVRGWRVRIDGADGSHRRGLVDPLTDPGLAGFSNWHALLHALAPNASRLLTGQELRAVGARIWEGLVVASGLAAVLDGLGDRVPRRYTLEIDEESDPHLAVLPFELAFAGEGVGYHFKRAHPRAVRVLSQRPARPVRLGAGTRLLVATAASPGQAPDAPELAAHAASIAGLAQARGWDVRCLAEATPAALEAALQDPRGTDVLYVVAHGAADPNTFGRLALVGDDLTGSDLKRMLEDTAATARPCRAVLLCACSGALAQPGLRAETTGMAQALAQHAVEAAIGFRAPVGVAWALGFMERLFDHLGHDPDLEGAFARVRAVLPEHDPQWPLLAYYGRPLAPAPAGRPGVEAPSAGALPASELPAPSRWFTAREVELRRLDALLRTPGAAVIHALEGEGGVGKTELARVAADRLAGERPVIWLDRPDRDVRAALDALLAAGAGEDAAGFRDESDDALVARVRALLAGRGGLLVLDDVADGDALGPLLPGSNWNVLVTTRVAALLPDADRVEVGPLAPADARLLFCRVAWGVDDPPSGEAEALSGLLADLGGLPLALELAAESVNQGARVADYRAGLGQDFGRAWADQARLRTVLARTLDELGADERAAFEALGALPVSGADALTVALTLGWPEGRATRTLDTLARHRAARYAPQTGRFGLHPLLRDEARARLRGRPGAWDAAHAGVAAALFRRVWHAWSPLRRQPALARARWAPLAEVLGTLDLQPWLDGAAGGVDLLMLLAYPGGELRDRTLTSAQRRDAHAAAVALGRKIAADAGEAVVGPALATACNNLGDVCAQLSDGPGAHAAFQEGLDIARRLVAQDPYSATALRDLSVSLSKLGDLALRTGDGAGARAAFQEGLDIRRRLVAQDPDSAHALRDLSVSLSKLGDLALRTGDGAGARAAFQAGLDIHRRLVAQDPDSATALRDLSVSLSKLGDLVLRTGDGAGARAAFQEGLDIDRRLVAQDPDSAHALRDLSVSLERLGDLALRTGDGAGARAAFQEGLDIRRRLVAQDPDSAHALRDLSVSLERLGDLALRTGDGAGARAAFQEGLDIDRRLVAQDPDSAHALRDLSVSLERLGDLALRTGDGAGARAAFQEGLDIRRRLVAQDPDSATALRDLSVSLNKLGDLALRTGDGAGARAAFQEGLDIARRLVAQDPDSADALRDLSVSLERLGDLALRTGDGAGARAALQEGLDIRRRLVAQDPDSAAALRDLIVSLFKLGQQASGASDWSAADAWLGEATDQARALHGRAPSDPDFRQVLGVVLLSLAAVRDALGDAAGAQAALAEAAALETP